jgi:CDP-paratose 2-epimerase
MIVVFGGAGFIGSHVAEYFASEGEAVRVVDNESRGALMLHEGALSNWDLVSALPNVEMIDASITDGDALPELVKGATRIVHAAGQTAVTLSVTDPKTDFQVNALGTVNVLEAIRATAPGAKVVFCSTNKVYGGNVNTVPHRREGNRYVLTDGWEQGIPENLSIDLCEHSPYGVSKTSADLYVQEYGHQYGVQTCVFRMSCIYGTRQWGVSDQGWLAWFARAILEGLPITIFGDGYQTRDVLDVRDLVLAIDSAFRVARPAQVFNIGGGPKSTLSVTEALNLFEDIIGHSPEIRHAPARPSDQRVYISDIAKARRELNWEPRIPPRSGLREMVSSMRSMAIRGGSSRLHPEPPRETRNHARDSR